MGEDLASAADPIALFNLGNRLWRTGNPAEAARTYEQALALGFTHARLNLGNVYLCLGRDAEGWRLYQARDERRNSLANRLGFPEWQGEPLDGKRLFIWVEQGLGDQIFAARFVPLVRAAQVTLVTWPELAPLFQGFPATIVPRTDPVSVSPEFDYWTLPLSLPQWVSPVPCPYLSAQPRPSGGRIGVMWKGNDRPDPNRSLPASLAQRLLDLPGAISLQPEDTGVRDFRETAEIVAGLDCVVTIDTSVAHLTGALGKPGFVLLQKDQADWRWREAAPGVAAWYPSLRLIRQPSQGDWHGAIDAVLAALDGAI
ncbi:MAG: tetratricopeptide repeat protein [Caulobacterales bacterium]|nr:tetratricopeptide repeat protein [Caulobacterales bacterium]